MYRTLVGEAGFRKGMDLYFKRHDGQAVSCDDFRAAMADANGVNLDQFERWYLQVLLLLFLLLLLLLFLLLLQFYCYCSDCTYSYYVFTVISTITTAVSPLYM